MYILGLSGGLGHDPAACLIHNGAIVCMVEEERFTRHKHAPMMLPINSIIYCLVSQGITLSDISYIALGWHATEDIAHITLSEIKDLFREHSFFDGHSIPSIVEIDHHLAHAAAAYYCSGYENATIIVMDGHGEQFSTTISHGIGNSISILNNFGISDSLGHFYQAITRHLGYGFGEEGKVMGLASYGIPRFDFPLIQSTDSGYHVSIPEPPESSNQKKFEFVYNYWMSWLADHLGPPNSSKYSFEPTLGYALKQTNLNELHKDIAASAQKKLEQIISHLVNLATQQTNCRNLVLGGGVALNVSANGNLLRSNLIDSLYIFPASNDAGTSAGAALAVYYQLFPSGNRKYKFENAYMGPSFTEDTIGNLLLHNQINSSFSDNITARVAELLYEEKIVGWFQGKLEVGPRALGNRSILATPTKRKMHNKVNYIKGRENWRPLAPALLCESASSYLLDERLDPFMTTQRMVKENKTDQIPAAIHIDGSCRPQFVCKQTNELFWSLLRDFQNISSVPVLLNTSFNLRGEPIVCNPLDALRTFFTSGLDVLVLGNFIIYK